MTTIPPPLLTGLSIINTLDRGKANSERVVLYAFERLELSRYGLLLGWKQHDSPNVWPLRDNFLWLGNNVVEAGTWIYVYTGPGEFRRTTVAGTMLPAIVLHWGRERTALADTSIVPVLVNVGVLEIGEGPADTPQGLLSQGSR